MKKTFLLSILFAIVLSINQIAVAFETELWPGEQAPSFNSKKDVLILHERPHRNSPTINYTTKKDEKITFDQIRHRTIKPIIVNMEPGSSIDARSFGRIDYISVKKYDTTGIAGDGISSFNKITFGADDSIEYLQYRAEGSCFFRWKQDVYEGDKCWFANAANANVELWIRVIKDKKPVGWLFIDSNSVYSNYDLKRLENKKEVHN